MIKPLTYTGVEAEWKLAIIAMRKSILWVSFSFLQGYGAPLSGPSVCRSSAKKLNLRAPLPKILISNFHPKIGFAHNSSINFTGQVGNKYVIISEKLSFFKIL